MRHRYLLLLSTLVFAPFVFAQQAQLSPGVGNAVLLAKNSIQIDNAVVVVSGDLIVNNATSGPTLGQSALSLDNGVTTPAGYKLAATSIAIGHSATVSGDVYYNTLTNQGTIAGVRFTPLALPVYATLPAVSARAPGSTNITVPNGGQVTLDEGAYGDLVVGNSGTVHLTGGGYAFRSITVRNGGAALRYSAPTDIVVSGRVELGNGSIIKAENNSSLTASAIRIQVNGINGANGALSSTPPSVHVSNASTVFANIYAPAGSIVFDQSVEGTGAFIARDIHISQACRLTINSAFNQPPVAIAQAVSTNGSAPLQITLTGSDPEGATLTFSIVSGPHGGTLSAPVSASSASATITYTPASASVADSFTFRVTDPAGASGDATVTVNQTPEDSPPNPTTVVATNGSAQATKDVPATLLLAGTAPAGVALTFSIVSGTGPFHGSLGAVTQGSEIPERTATVVYTPDAGYVGPDSFQFQACGVIASVNVCATASFSITVQTALSDPPSIAHDVEVSTSADTSVLLSLGETSITTASRRLVLKPLAATLIPVAIAGNVADSNGDHLGDNVNALPGAAPVFMSAGVNQAGTAGSGGTVRMQFEWDMAGLSGSLSNLQSAQVILPTNRGTVDSLDTFFYAAGVSGDGNLTNSDFEAPAEQIPGAVMSVPPTMPIGSDGTFSFDVLGQLRAAAQSGFSFFAIQGRVDESLTGPQRGLQVRTTASGNIGSGDVPKLAVATPGITAPLTYTITALPLSGVLRDSFNGLITNVPYALSSPQVNYTPNSGFLGLDTFSFSVSNGVISSSAFGRISVMNPVCQTSSLGCNNGR